MQKLSEVEAFEEAGKKYLEEYDKKGIDKLKSSVVEWKEKADKAKAPGSGSVIDASAYSRARKDAALWARSPKQADDVLRDPFGDMWRRMSKEEKDALYEYTRSYSKFNEPLRGWEYGKSNYRTGRGYKGIGNTDLNAGYANNGERLNAMTDAIDRCAYSHDMWAQRGVDYGGMDKFFGVDADLLFRGSQSDLEQSLIGKVVTEYGFFSCGDAKGSGFSDRPIIMNVYAPSGSKYVYAEPFSHFGAETHDIGYGRGVDWDGYKNQKKFGTEAEVIFQQGTMFQVTKVERSHGTLYVDMDVLGTREAQRWQG